MSAHYARTKTRLALRYFLLFWQCCLSARRFLARTTKNLSVRTIYRQSAHSSAMASQQHQQFNRLLCLCVLL